MPTSGSATLTPPQDPVLLLLPRARPGAFDVLDPDERGWRARLFLVLWSAGYPTEQAWFLALNPDTESLAELRADVADVPDEEIPKVIRGRESAWNELLADADPGIWLGTSPFPIPAALVEWDDAPAAPTETIAPLRARQDRRSDMQRMRAQGATLEEIGHQYGLTRERVRQVLATAPAENGRPRKQSSGVDPNRGGPRLVPPSPTAVVPDAE